MKTTVILILVLIASYLTVFGCEIATSWRSLLLNDPCVQVKLDPRFGKSNEVCEWYDTTPAPHHSTWLIVGVLGISFASGAWRMVRAPYLKRLMDSRKAMPDPTSVA